MIGDCAFLFQWPLPRLIEVETKHPTRSSFTQGLLIALCPSTRLCKNKGRSSRESGEQPRKPARTSSQWLCPPHHASPRFSVRVPNDVFQTVFFRFLTSACGRGKPLQRDKECLKTPILSTSILAPSTLAVPDHTLIIPF